MPNVLSLPPISFEFQTTYNLKNRGKIRALIRNMFLKERKKCQALVYVFCSDDYLLDINQRFLKHDFFTDVITFDLRDSLSAPISGEIYISIDRVRENAKIHGVSIQDELHRVMFHGVLHLCGYKDKSPDEIAQMRNTEEKYLRLFKRST